MGLLDSKSSAEKLSQKWGKFEYFPAPAQKRVSIFTEAINHVVSSTPVGDYIASQNQSRVDATVNMLYGKSAQPADKNAAKPVERPAVELPVEPATHNKLSETPATQLSIQATSDNTNLDLTYIRQQIDLARESRNA